jgi:hypothetical protein
MRLAAELTRRQQEGVEMAFTERRKANGSTTWTGEERRTRGAHPVGTRIGAAAGGIAAGAAAGAVAGPAGAVAGAAVGAVVGGLAGKGVAEMIDPTAEEAYWSQNYTREPYYERGYTYADYHPGYRTGWEARARYAGRNYEDIEHELESHYNRNRGDSRLGWEKNRHAARAAWERFDAGTDPFERSQ